MASDDGDDSDEVTKQEIGTVRTFLRRHFVTKSAAIVVRDVSVDASTPLPVTRHPSRAAGD